MKTRYDWNEMPDWANYVVTYPDGSIQAHETMPKAHVYYEHWNYGPFKNFLPKIIKQVGETPDWRESLEERPKKPKRMKTEYDWNSYPKWVKYVAVDDDMEVWGYSHKPYAVEQSGCWTTGNESHHKNIQLGHVYVPDWKSSLQRRPKQ